MATRQASLLCKLSVSPLSFPSSSYFRSCSSSKCVNFSRLPSFISYNPLSLSFYSTSLPRQIKKVGFCIHPSSISCTLHPESANLDSESSSPDTQFVPLNEESKSNGFGDWNSSLNGESSGSGVEGFDTNEISSTSGVELKSKFSEVGKETESENVVESEGKSGTVVGTDDKKNWLPLLAFLLGVWTRTRTGFEKMLMWDWLSWWPFWRQEKRLEHLIAEADANPKDAAKQSALLVELNKHRLETMVQLLFLKKKIVFFTCGSFAGKRIKDNEHELDC